MLLIYATVWIGRKSKCQNKTCQTKAIRILLTALIFIMILLRIIISFHHVKNETYLEYIIKFKTYHTMKAQFYQSVKPIKPVRTFQVYILAVVSYLLFAAMLFAMAFGKDVLNVLK